MRLREPVVPKGFVLFIRDATLMAQPVDPDSFKLTGDPYHITAPIDGAIMWVPGNSLYWITILGYISQAVRPERIEWPVHLV